MSAILGHSQRVDALDMLGFWLPELTPQQKADRASTLRTAVLCEGMWAKYAASKTLPREKKRKALIRKVGVPAALRAWVWSEISGANELRASKPSSYFHNLVVAAPSCSQFLKQIDLDVPRTYPLNARLQAQQGRAALRAVLAAFSLHDPQVGYCQGMNYVAGLLLVATNMEAETAFWLLAALVGQVLLPHTYSPSLSGCQVEMRTLGELVGDKLPHLHKHLGHLGCDVALLSTDWFLTLYALSLPAEVAVRVWDALMGEGPKVLFRVGLALLRVHEHQLLDLDNAGECLHALKYGSQRMWGADGLLHVAFDRVGSLPLARMARIRHRQQVAVDADMAVRERARVLAELRAAAAAKSPSQPPSQPAPASPEGDSSRGCSRSDVGATVLSATTQASSVQVGRS